MALIKCSECGKEISSKAAACPYCGCPIEATVKEGIVRIKMPNNIVEGWVGLFSSRDAIVKDKSGKTLWQGQHGENAKFTVNEPTHIIIELGGWANPCEGLVEPNRKYSLVQDMGAHWLATFRLTEVDIIDAD